MTLDNVCGVKTRGHKRKRERGAQAGEALPGLPLDVVCTHVLRSDRLPDTADLARLRAVSLGMRQAVEATGRKVNEMSECDAIMFGCLSALQRRHRRGRLSRKVLLCQAAAQSGQLEELKSLRANRCPWDEYTCSSAASSGHLEMLQWARANGCPWDEWTCTRAAYDGQLEVLKWARANSCPWNEKTCAGAARSGQLEVLKWARERLSVGGRYVRKRGILRTARGFKVGACEWMSRILEPLERTSRMESSLQSIPRFRIAVCILEI